MRNKRMWCKRAYLLIIIWNLLLDPWHTAWLFCILVSMIVWSSLRYHYVICVSLFRMFMFGWHLTNQAYPSCNLWLVPYSKKINWKTLNWFESKPLCGENNACHIFNRHITYRSLTYCYQHIGDRWPSVGRQLGLSIANSKKRLSVSNWPTV